MSYQGPHVKVRQNFETTPPAVSVENLPSALVGTAYEVHKDEVLLSYDGIDANGTDMDDTTAPWIVEGSNKTIYSASQGSKIYNFYPPVTKVIDDENGGTFDVDLTVGATGVVVPHFSKYTIASVAASTKAYIPYFTANGTTDTDSKMVTCPTGQFLSRKLVKGLRVISATDVIGYIDYVESETVLYLTANALQDVSSAALYFGAAEDLTAKPAYIYDPDTNFTRLNVKRGDVVSNVVSSDLASSPISNASIVSIVSENLIEIYSGTAQSGNYANNNPIQIDKVYSAGGDTIASTANVQSYDIERFVGFTEKYDNSANNRTCLSISGTTLTLSGSFALAVGDKVVTANKSYTIIGGSDSTYTLDRSDTVGAGAIYMFKSSDLNAKIVNQVSADYRAVVVANTGVVFKSSDNQLTGSAGLFGIASVYNDLAFMIQTAQAVNANRVLYVVAVDPTVNITTAYSDAFEALKFYDVYSHALGTTEAGVNALAPAYVDEQSEPYEAHERTATLAYDEDDVYLLGSGTMSMSIAGALTSSTVNLITAGISIGDTIEYTADDGEIYEATVTGTPSSASAVQTNATEAATTKAVTFYAGTKSKQATRIKSLSVGNRRVTVIWPGSFYANTTAAGDVPALSNVKLPAYYISALVVGLDGGQKVSQSLTRFVTQIAGLSNIALNTNSYFRKADLDNIASAGIDIYVQDNPISNSIYSRHDLTTDMSSVETRERSVTKQADQAAKTTRTAIDPYVGKYNIDNNLLRFIDQVVSIVGKTVVKDGVVSGYEAVSVQRDPDIADKINVVVKITVFIAGNYYDIDLNIKSR